jgi:pimeloyl-ACP methyl ester carboxylesterase
MYLSSGGIEQWVQFSGDNPGNPILLYLHGGPGGSSRPAAAAWKPWERHFRVVHWDQRGTGLTFKKHGEALAGTLTTERMVRDGIELVEYLRSRFGAKLVLVGHSWGSVLGLHMIRRNPDLFAAYVGTGQVVNMRRKRESNYETALAQALASNNEEALAALREIGPPPFVRRESMSVLLQWADKLARGSGDEVRPHLRPIAPDFSAEDRDWLMRGASFSREQLEPELALVDLPSLGFDFSVPMFLFHGTDDSRTPLDQAEAYFSQIKAPYKEIVRFEGCHHFVVMNRPDDFLAALVRHVLPVAA